MRTASVILALALIAAPASAERWILPAELIPYMRTCEDAHPGEPCNPDAWTTDALEIVYRRPRAPKPAPPPNPWAKPPRDRGPWLGPPRDRGPWQPPQRRPPRR